MSPLVGYNNLNIRKTNQEAHGRIINQILRPSMHKSHVLVVEVNTTKITKEIENVQHEVRLVTTVAKKITSQVYVFDPKIVATITII